MSGMSFLKHTVEIQNGGRPFSKTGSSFISAVDWDISTKCGMPVDFWRDALETVINSRKLTDAQANPSTQRKRYLSPIWQITLYITDKEQLYALLKN